ncbi:glycoside hydrolase family 3 N-terminal domain-containing protein [Leifsonia sp. NPDC058230]|uniref:glycoside hydrolase family 3 N-terminal domain-containing protein n=1 Tax=Leifsonia sp. NPDC058230 TaxID=3346391 RepID=UPI0036DDDD8B
MIGLPRARTRARTVALVASALVLALGASGCAASTSGSLQSPTHTAGPTRTPTPTPTVDPVTAFARARVATMTLREQVASLFMLHQPGTDGVALRSFIDQYGAGGMILMGDNIPPTPEALAAQTAAMTSDPLLPPLIAIDEEGGDVTRLPWDTLPGATALRAQPAETTQSVFAQRAALLKNAGVTVNFGTVADVTADPRSFIFDRVLGTTPSEAAPHVSASVAGERGTVFSTLKHFPGHGETDADSHLTVPTTPVSIQGWTAQDAPPFAAGIAAGAEFVMFGHLVYSAVDGAPASLSTAWHSILSEQLGFHGVAITDDMRMLQDTGLPEYQNPVENTVRALAAGNTMVLFVLPANPAASGLDPNALVDGVVAAVQAGRIPAAQIETDARKLLELRRSLGSE